MTSRSAEGNLKVHVRTLTSRLPWTKLQHWPAVAAWWSSRACIQGPAQELCDVVFFPVRQASGLHLVHHTWAGTFVLAALYLVFPGLNIVLLDSDCVPVTLFEVEDLWQEAEDSEWPVCFTRCCAVFVVSPLCFQKAQSFCIVLARQCRKKKMKICGGKHSVCSIVGFQVQFQPAVGLGCWTRTRWIRLRDLNPNHRAYSTWYHCRSGRRSPLLHWAGRRWVRTLKRRFGISRWRLPLDEPFSADHVQKAKAGPGPIFGTFFGHWARRILLETTQILEPFRFLFLGRELYQVTTFYHLLDYCGGPWIWGWQNCTSRAQKLEPSPRQSAQC